MLVFGGKFGNLEGNRAILNTKTFNLVTCLPGNEHFVRTSFAGVCGIQMKLPNIASSSSRVIKCTVARWIPRGYLRVDYNDNFPPVKYS